MLGFVLEAAPCAFGCYLPIFHTAQVEFPFSELSSSILTSVYTLYLVALIYPGN